MVARRLAQAGWDVTVASLVPREALTGDAAAMAAQWTGPVAALAPSMLDGRALVVDALFGAGLARPVDGPVAAVIAACGAERRVVAIDLPSGIAGDTGAVLGAAFEADLTVTFFRKKPGHLLFPGRAHCGEVLVAQIGIDRAVLDTIGPQQFENGLGLWAGAFPTLRADGHKYQRGHTLVLAGGPLNTGAARLAARAALRVGSGLVTTVAGAEAARVIAGHQTAVMVEAAEGPAEFAALLADKRRNAVVLGPGAGLHPGLFDASKAALESGAAVVLDADALTMAAGQADRLWAARRGTLVLTPHDGEFARVFPGLLGGSRAERARAAAAASGAVVLLKGADSCIAAPDGRVAINTNAPPTLATAGSGDVLAGAIGGLLAQGMPAFEAACAGAWLHGAAAEGFGRGLIAEDLVERLPLALQTAEKHLRGRGSAG
ncbi:NAD(P)H-hydrate dehydratase [Oleomonas cavernae]|uniref:NAD(P)H-hydrate dehydratase n=1 Tax=Oleomonas cavernae TaxID=2320859 RepID=UPI002693D3EF